MVLPSGFVQVYKTISLPVFCTSKEAGEPEYIGEIPIITISGAAWTGGATGASGTTGSSGPLGASVLCAILLSIKDELFTIYHEAFDWKILLLVAFKIPSKTSLAFFKVKFSFETAYLFTIISWKIVSFVLPPTFLVSFATKILYSWPVNFRISFK